MPDPVPTVSMRIEQRGDKFVVLPESGDKVLGTHATREEAEKQLAGIEASKARGMDVSMAAIDNTTDANGRVIRVGDSVVGPGFGSLDGAVIDQINEYPGSKYGIQVTVKTKNGQQWTVERKQVVKFDYHGALLIFDALRDPTGKVRAHVWDRVCVPGEDEKDGRATAFNADTLGQMVRNFAARGDQLPMDWNHQGQYARENGQPAPALAWYGALALLWGGQVVACEAAKGVDAGDLSALAGKDDGLWAYRCEVTEIGEKLLPSFKYLSPTFTPQGTDREGNQIGYCLIAVAATNTPWQSGTEINFGTNPAPGGGENKMPKLGRLAKFAGVKDDSDDKEIKQGILARMANEPAAAMEEGYDYGASAAAMEEAARAYEDAHMEEGENDAPPHIAMRKMAANFRRMAKMAAPEPPPHKEPDGDEPAAMDVDPSNKAQNAAIHLKTGNVNDHQRMEAANAKVATMEASNRALAARLAKLEAEETKRQAAVAAAEAQRFESLADAAISGGYPKESRASLVAFARSDFKAAATTVAHFLPKTGAPPHLFDRMTSMGGPVNFTGESAPRSYAGPAATAVRETPFATVVTVDDAFAAEIERVAFSQDAATIAKVDAHITSTKERPQKAARLIAAEKVVTMERPDLAAAEKNARISMGR